MKREEEISKAIDNFLNKEDLTCLSCSAYSFKKGVEQADKHPKPPWISIKNDLPCNHPELLADKYTTKSVLTKTERLGMFVQYMYWTYTGWRFSEGGGVIYWMSIPELPKD